MVDAILAELRELEGPSLFERTEPPIRSASAEYRILELRKALTNTRLRRGGDYYASSHWRSVAAWVKRERGHRCESCGSSAGLHAHHNDEYVWLGEERPIDLTVLCMGCHNEAHGWPRKGLSGSPSGR